MTGRCGSLLSWGESCTFPSGHLSAHGIDLGRVNFAGRVAAVALVEPLHRSIAVRAAYAFGDWPPAVAK